MKKKLFKNFTLIEILIVVSLIILLAIIALITFNPKKQIEKSQDSKRKTELTQLQKVLEDWYNDKNCYPNPEEICYDTPVNNTCHICGNHQNSPNFSPYLNTLPCDPQYPTKNYLYQVDDNICPKKYWIYAKFSTNDDPIISQTNCTSGCGPSNNCNFNVGFTSPNTSPEQCLTSPSNIPTITPQPTTQTNCRDYSALYVLSNTNICNICGTYQQCLNIYPDKPYFIDNQCTMSCIKN